MGSKGWSHGTDATGLLRVAARMDCYSQAARRHYADAVTLANAHRLDNAGHLIGFAAECAVKEAVSRLGRAVPQGHFPRLYSRIPQVGGRNSLSQIRRAMSQRGQQVAFSDWDIGIRYRADGSVDASRFATWRRQAGQVMAAAGIGPGIA